MVTNLESVKIESGLNNFQQVLFGVSGFTFNCYYSVTDPSGITNSNSKYSLKLIAWNVLYSLGYMYTDLYTVYSQ
jgi:hypothetical protein